MFEKNILFSKIEIAKLLIDHGADVYAKATYDDREWTPLDVANYKKGKFNEQNGISFRFFFFHWNLFVFFVWISQWESYWAVKWVSGDGLELSGYKS